MEALWSSPDDLTIMCGGVYYSINGQDKKKIHNLLNIPLSLSRVGIAHQKTLKNTSRWAVPTLLNFAYHRAI